MKVRVFVGDMGRVRKDREAPFLVAEDGKVVARARTIRLEGIATFVSSRKAVVIRDGERGMGYRIHAWVEFDADECTVMHPRRFH